MKKIIICFLILLSNVILAQEKNNLIFEESIYSVKININDGKDFLELDKENKIQIISKKIDLVNMSCVGLNLTRGGISTNKNISNWNLSILKKDLKEGKYSLTITFRGRRGKLFKHEFLIDVK